MAKKLLKPESDEAERKQFSKLVDCLVAVDLENRLDAVLEAVQANASGEEDNVEPEPEEKKPASKKRKAKK